jgi:hypothetical protein
MAEGGGGTRTPLSPDFGISKNGGGSASASHYYSPAQISRPSAITALYLNLAFTFPKAKITLKSPKSLDASTLYYVLIPLYLVYSTGNKD